MRPASLLPLLAALLLAPPLAAQDNPGVATQPATTRVRIVTTEGPIVLALETARAPLSAANFLRYVDGRRLDGTTIYRAVKSAPGYGFIQGGVNNDPKRMLPPIAHEPTTKTGLTHADGTISLPRLAPGTARGEFFITVGAIPSMDADPKQPGDNAGFAAFGHIVEGMEIVRHMLDAPTSPTAGPPALRGSMLVAPVRILTARREK